MICEGEEEEGEGESVKAQVSTTCVPYVLIIFMVWPVRRGVAMPWRAGMGVSWEDMFWGWDGGKVCRLWKE